MPKLESSQVDGHALHVTGQSIRNGPPWKSLVHIQAWLTHVAEPYAGMLPTTSTHGTATVGATVVGGIDGGVARVGARVCVGTAEGGLGLGSLVVGASVGRGVGAHPTLQQVDWHSRR